MGVPASAFGSIYTVSGTTDSTSACVGTSCPSLRAAVIAADGDPGSTIMLGAAEYTLGDGSGTPVGTGELLITADMAIIGSGPGETTIRQTDGLDRVIAISAGAVTISGVRLTGGVVLGGPGANGTPSPGSPGGTVAGGGIENAGSLALQDVVVSGNSVKGGLGGNGGQGPGTPGNAGAGGNAEGGGISTSGPLTLMASSVSGNAATGGRGGGAFEGTGGAGGNATGGIYVEPLSTGMVTLQASTVSNNTAAGGAGGPSTEGSSLPGSGGEATGGISQWSQTLALLDSSVSGNTATGGAGGEGALGPNGAYGGDVVAAGAALVGGTLLIERTTISGNIAQGGAGGPADGTTSGGGGTVFGGGLYVQQDATLVNVTIAGNGATAGTPGVPFGGGVTGPAGDAFGGGIDDDGGGSETLTLASATLAFNAAGTGGNLWAAATGLSVGDTIIASGAASTGANCVASGAMITDLGHNLESTTPSQCEFSSASADQVGANPALGPLSANGGPTQTLALGPASPALGSGATCTDPTKPGNPPLAVDQRGLPRPLGSCDIGAFQAQRPANTSAPTITGTPQPANTLSCSQGTWNGDGTLSYAYQWLRDGTPIAGASAAAYVVQAADAGHQLTCRVTATGTYGSTSTAVSVTVPVASVGRAPVLTDAAETYRTWREGNALAQISHSHKPMVGTTFSFALNESAAVRFAFTQAAGGRKVGTPCVAQTKGNRHRQACMRRVTAATLTFSGHTGTDEVRFEGHVSRSKKLKPGRYTLVITATNAAGQSGPLQLSFTIIK